MRAKCLPALAAIALLTACDVKIGNEAGTVSENASAAGRAEEGRVTIEAPGFNMSMNIPGSELGDTKIDDDRVIYPGAQFGGVHVQGRPGRSGEDGSGEVELRFTTADPPDRVVAWYRDPARHDDIVVASAERQGEGFHLSGTAGDEKKPFDLRIMPRSGRGTEARLLISDGK
jgi:hypothetical protein